MAIERKTSEVGPLKFEGESVPSYKGIEKLLWYIFDKGVSRIEAAGLIHVYCVAWADARDKKRKEILERAAPHSGTESTIKAETASAA